MLSVFLWAAAVIWSVSAVVTIGFFWFDERAYRKSLSVQPVELEPVVVSHAATSTLLTASIAS